MNGERCYIHREESLDIYCEDCRQTLCVLCLTLMHDDHVTCDVTEAAIRRRRELNTAIDDIDLKLAEFRAADDKILDCQLDEVFVNYDEIRRHVTRSTDLFFAEVGKKVSQLNVDLDGDLSKQLQAAEDRRLSLEQQIHDLELLLVRCKLSVGKTYSPNQLLTETKDLMLNVGDLRVDVDDRILPYLRQPPPRYQSFLQWRLKDLMTDGTGTGRFSSDDDDVGDDYDGWDGDHAIEVLEEWLSVKDSLWGTLDQYGSPTSSLGKNVRRLQECGEKLFQMANGLERELLRTRARTSKLSAALRRSKELLREERQRQADAMLADHTQRLQAALTEVDHLLLMQDRQQQEAELRRLSLSVTRNPVDIAVVGNTGVGKSSFINAVRGLTADDRGAAAVGVNECTVEVTAYTHPDDPQIKFWDLPGVGTDRFPKDNYLQLVKLERFDLFVIVSATRFTENDTWLVKEIAKRGKKFCFVRTKVALDVSNNRKSHPRTHNETAVVAEIMESTRTNLAACGNAPDTEVFLIDSYAPDKFDFQQLEQFLLQVMPNLKRETAATKNSCVVS